MPSYLVDAFETERKGREARPTPLERLNDPMSQPAAPVPLPDYATPEGAFLGAPSPGSAPLSFDPNMGSSLAGVGFENGVPNDALLDRLAWVESRNNPNAVSPAGAVGPAQIMPGTARAPGFGVPAISMQDARDRAKSLAWARQYLSAMYARYGNPIWTLAAYNAGPGTVDRAIANGGFSALPEETRNYVPQFGYRP